jgi:ribosomal protein L11 methyltransferase
VKDFVLEISYQDADQVLNELLMSRLVLSRSSGSSSAEVSGTVTISAYFASAEDRDAAAADLGDLSGVELHASDRERIDWLEHYQQSLEPLLIARSFIVVPDAALIPSRTDRHRLLIPQEQAFGTGSHETTSLCIELLESIELRGRRGLDIGSGSGILALAMCRLGATKVVAFDHDTDAFGALRDNRSRNGVDPVQMPIFIGSVEALRGGRFDAVTMNIIPEVILPLLGEVKRHVGGALILSGILVVKRDEVVRACTAHDLALTSERAKGVWWAGCFRSWSLVR